MRALILALGSLPTVAHATDFHVCDCQRDADSDCAPGDDSLAGTTPETAWRSYPRARAAFEGTLMGGDRLLFCAGGAFEADGGTWVNDSCSQSSPCTVSRYSPDWGGTTAPVLHSRGHTVLYLANAGDAVQQEGYRFEGLDLRCVGCEETGGMGVFLFNDVDHVTLRDLSISGFAIGVQQAGSNPCASWDSACDGSSSDLHIIDTTIQSSSVMGFLGAADGLRIVDSQFVENGTHTAFEHNLYISGAAAPTQGIELRGNRLYRSAWQAAGSCEGTSLVVHGQHDDLAIIGNTVEEDPGTAGPGCWGIALDAAYWGAEAFRRAVIADNAVVTVGNVAIGLSACEDCIVENNTVLGDAGMSTTGVLAPNREVGEDDARMARLVVRNNSLSLPGGGAGVALPDEVDQHVVVSNAIDTTAGDCFAGPVAPGDWLAFSHNVCTTGAGDWMAGVGTLSDWQALGWGTASQDVAPGFADPAAGAWQSATAEGPLIDAGDPARSSSHDGTGQLRDAMPDVGAREWTAPEDTAEPHDTSDPRDSADPSDPTTPGDTTDPGPESAADDGAGKDSSSCAGGGLAPLALWLGLSAAVRRRRDG